MVGVPAFPCEKLKEGVCLRRKIKISLLCDYSAEKETGWGDLLSVEKCSGPCIARAISVGASGGVAPVGQVVGWTCLLVRDCCFSSMSQWFL